MGFYGTGATGTLANDQDAVAAEVALGQRSALVAASGTLKGTVNFEATVDGTNWAAIQVLQVGTSTLATTAAVDGSGGAITTAWVGNVGGFTQVRARLHPTTSGSATVTVRMGSAPAQITTPAELLAAADGATTATVPEVQPGLFNGATTDRQRGNLDNIAIVAAGAHTTTQTQADQTNYNHRGIKVALDVTAYTAGGLTLEIDMKDPVSGKYVALLTAAKVQATGTHVFTVYPGNTVAANVSASDVLPRTWRVVVTADDATSITYSCGAMLIV